MLNGFSSRGVLVDTNLLLLLIVGAYRIERIASFNRTRKYTSDDFDLLLTLVARFDRRVTTPNILTETDNLVRQIGEREYAKVTAVFSRVVAELFEIYQPSLDAVESTYFARLGLADCITISAAQDTLVLTDDFRLSNILMSLGREAININHIRSLE